MIGLGELGVIAITALQYGYPAFMTIDLGAIALSMMRVEGRGEQIHSVRAGWNMADRIKPLMGVRWEEGLDKPLDVWRKELKSSLYGKVRTAGTKCSRIFRTSFASRDAVLGRGIQTLPHIEPNPIMLAALNG
jgi:hypothetical protein